MISVAKLIILCIFLNYAENLHTSSVRFASVNNNFNHFKERLAIFSGQQCNVVKINYRLNKVLLQVLY